MVNALSTPFVVCGNNPVIREPTLIIFQGTTEKIFEEKKELYDVYIDNQNVKTHRSHLQSLLRLNAADKEKYRKLSEQRYAIHCNPHGYVSHKENETFAEKNLK